MSRSPHRDPKLVPEALLGEAHQTFDRLWINYPKANRRAFRQLCYDWLADSLGIQQCRAHFSEFDSDACHRAIALCRGATWRDIEDWARERRPRRNPRKLLFEIPRRDAAMETH